MTTYVTGVILAIHHSREPGDFVVSKRVVPLDGWYQSDVDKYIKEQLKQTTFGDVLVYPHVWFVPVTLPEG